MNLDRAASFPRFAWPKTTLQPRTEHGLTSEFGMGSGGSRTLWPANPKVHGGSSLINFSLLTRAFLFFLQMGASVMRVCFHGVVKKKRADFINFFFCSQPKLEKRKWGDYSISL